MRESADASAEPSASACAHRFAFSAYSFTFGWKRERNERKKYCVICHLLSFLLHLSLGRLALGVQLLEDAREDALVPGRRHEVHWFWEGRRKKGRRNGGRKEGGMERNDSYNQFFLIPSFYSPLTFCADVVLVHSVEVLHRRVEDVRRVTQVVCTHDRGVERHPVERRDRLLVEPLLRLIYRRALERGGT